MTTQDRLPYGPSEKGDGEVSPDLDSDLATIFARERRAHPTSPAQKERVLSRLERSLNLGPGDPGGGGGGGGAVATSASSTRSIPAFTRFVGTLSMAACVVVGVSLVWSVASDGSTARTVASPEPVALPVSSGDVSSRASSDAPAEPTAEVTAIPVEALPSVRTPVERANGGQKIEPAAACTICEERTILEAGRRGLREKNGALSLAAIDEHESRFPTGQLAEERESLRVHVLFALGHVEEAEARKSDFVRLYPRSPLLESVKRAGIR